jgi:hypothetical protein
MQRDEGKLDPRREREREGGREREREKESSIPPFTHHPQIVLLEMQNAAGVPHTQSWLLFPGMKLWKMGDKGDDRSWRGGRSPPNFFPGTQGDLAARITGLFHVREKEQRAWEALEGAMNIHIREIDWN